MKINYQKKFFKKTNKLKTTSQVIKELTLQRVKNYPQIQGKVKMTPIKIFLAYFKKWIILDQNPYQILNKIIH